MAARAAFKAAEGVIFEYIAARHPEQARELTEYISTVMIGLSAKARQGQSLALLLSTVAIASRVCCIILRVGDFQRAGPAS